MSNESKVQKNIEQEIRALNEVKKSPLIKLAYISEGNTEEEILLNEDDIDVLIRRRKQVQSDIKLCNTRAHNSGAV